MTIIRSDTCIIQHNKDRQTIRRILIEVFALYFLFFLYNRILKMITHLDKLLQDLEKNYKNVISFLNQYF